MSVAARAGNIKPLFRSWKGCSLSTCFNFSLYDAIVQILVDVYKRQLHEWFWQVMEGRVSTSAYCQTDTYNILSIYCLAFTFSPSLFLSLFPFFFCTYLSLSMTLWGHKRQYIGCPNALIVKHRLVINLDFWNQTEMKHHSCKPHTHWMKPLAMNTHTRKPQSNTWATTCGLLKFLYGSFVVRSSTTGTTRLTAAALHISDITLLWQQCYDGITFVIKSDILLDHAPTTKSLHLVGVLL